LKRHCGDLAGTTPGEILDWLNIVKIMETALRRAFDVTMFNWSCYMNLSYRDTPPDPHIHWWVVPRYNHIVKMSTLIFADPRFGSPYDFTMRLDLSREIRQQIADRLKQAIA